MTISTEAVSAGPFDGNGVASSFSFAFKVFSDTDVRVINAINGELFEAALGTNFIVVRNADQDADPGGEIFWQISGVTAPLPVGESIYITSNVPATQGTALPTGGRYNAKILERMIDKCVMLIKQIRRDVNRALRQPLIDPEIMTEIPSAEVRRGKVLMFEDTAEADPTVIAITSLGGGSGGGSGIVMTAFMEALLATADDAAEARTILDISGGMAATAFAETLLDDPDSAAARLTLEILNNTVPSKDAPAAVAGVSTQAARQDHQHQYNVEAWVLPASDETTALTTGAGKFKMRAPYAVTVLGIRGSLNVAQAAGATLVTVDVNEEGVSILGTKLTFDNTEKTTVTATSPATITDPNIADDAEISVDIDGLTAGAAAGLKVTLIVRRSSAQP